MMAVSIQDAVALFQAGNMEPAERMFRSLLHADPANAETLYFHSLLLRHTERPADGAAALRRALALRPDFVEAWYGFGLCLETLGQSPDALNAFRRGARLRPGFILSLHQAGRILEKLERTAEAEDAYREGLAAEPHTAWLLGALGRLLARMERAAEAQPILRRALVLDPCEAESLRALGRCAYDAGRPELAEKLQRWAIHVLPEPIAGLYELSRTLYALGRGREALEAGWRSAALHYALDRKTARPARGFDEILDRIDAAVPAGFDRRGATVYIHARTGALGHVVMEPSSLRTGCDRRYPRFLLFCHPRNHFPKINRAIFEVAMRGVTVCETEDLGIIDLSWDNYGIFERDGTRYVLMDHHHVMRQAFLAVRRGEERPRAALTAEEMERGRAVARRMGVPEDAPVVLLHLREAGYHAHVTQFSYRDATPSNYFPAVRWLVRQGFVVVRVGDTSMTPLPDFGPRVVDAPFSPHYDPIVEPYFTDRCRFMISSLSGPHELARILKRPILTLNVPICSVEIPETPGLFAPKKYLDVSAGTPRPMGFREILERGLHHVYSSGELERREIRLEELSAHEILAITREMAGLMDGPFPPPSSPLQDAFRAVAEEENRRAEKNWKYAVQNLDWFGYAAPLARVSEEYGFYHPDFLDTGDPVP